MTRGFFLALFALHTVVSSCVAGAQASAQVAAAPQNAVAAPPSRAAIPGSQGRLQFDQYLDKLAEQDEATRAAAVAAVHTRAQAEARQAKVRAQILSLIGSLPQRTPLDIKFLGDTQADGFHIRKVLFESQPGFFVTALLYVPDGPAPGGKRAAILMSPGHAPSGKAGDAPIAAIFAGCSIPIPLSPAPHWPCALRASMAKPVCSPCSSATPLPATRFGTRCAAWIFLLRSPKSIRIALAPWAAPAEAQ
ncbi:MAG: hypothetical protein ABSB50_15535 [Terracidiphilus sp.]